MTEFEKKISRITTNDFVLGGEKLYFFNRYYGGLFAFDLNSEQIEHIFSIDEQNNLMTFSFNSITYVDTILACTPNCYDKLFLYDISKQQEELIDFDTNRTSLDITNYFKYVFAVRGSLYFVPGRYESVLKLDIETRRISYIDIDFNGVDAKNNYSSLIFASKYDGERYIYMTGMTVGKMWILDTQTDKIVKFDICSQGIKDMVLSEKHIYLLTEDYKILRFDMKTKSSSCIDIDKAFQKDMPRYLFLYNRLVYIVPLSGKYILSYDFQEELFDKVLEFGDGKIIYDDCNGVNIVACKKIIENQLLMYNDEQQRLYLVNFDNYEVKKYDLQMQEKDVSGIKKLFMSNLMEEGEIGLADFIDMIVGKG